ncbi:PGF-pre-PGF domain-containing protein [Methanococcoides sp. SA1]|nr:PGF-pre-PGF domain-containing protein [Methanococcoides sp. SA1]
MHAILRSRSSKCCLFLMLLVFTSFLIAPVSAETVVGISPHDQPIVIGSNVTVIVYIEPDVLISGAQFDLDFDSDILSVISISEGDVFTNGVSTLFFGGTIDNSEGNIMNVYNFPLGKNEVIKSGALATIVFETKSSGSSSLQLSNVVVSNSIGDAVPIAVINGMVSINGDSVMEVGEMVDAVGGGGGSSGGGATGEEFENIELKEITGRNVILGQVISFGFDEPENPIVSVNFTGLKNSGDISTTIEVLKGTSALVDVAPNGLVYKNLNIWVGKAGFATPGNIDVPTISFRVNNSWMDMYGVDSSAIRLNRYSENSWSRLETKVTYKDGKYVYFESKTPGFSPFAITAEGVAGPDSAVPYDETIILAEADISESEAVSDRSSTTQDDLPDEKALAQNTLAITILSIFVLVIGRRRTN